MIKNKNLFKNISILFCLVPMLLLSLFIANPRKIIKVYASGNVETGYTFHSSDTYSINICDNNWVSNGASLCLFSGDCSYVDSALTINPYFYICSINGVSVNYIQSQYYVLSSDEYGQSVVPWYEPFSIVRGVPYRILYSIDVDSYNSGSFYYGFVYASDQFNCNVYKVQLFLSDTNEFYTESRSDGLKFLNIKYFDANENYLSYSFLVPSGTYYSNRTYYLVSGDSLSDNQLYNTGYTDGYNAGNSDGNSSGYKEGYKVGEMIGYNNGYTQGVENAGKYTFTNLLGAVIDVPVKAFTSLFNFELLGVNLAGFFSGLLTLAVILTLVRLIKGG